MKENNKIVISKNISVDKEKIIEFLDEQDNVAIEQYPDWPSKGNYRYFYIKRNENIVAYVKVKEINAKLFKFARLDFVPPFVDKESGYDLINSILSYYKKNKYVYLSVQFGFPVSSISEYIDILVNRKYKVRYIYNPGNIWCSLRMSFNNNNIEEIFNTFTSGHKRAIKKTQNMLNVKKIEDEKELKDYFNIFQNMMNRKKINYNISYDDIYDIYKYLEKNKKGYILGVFTKDNKCIGGIIIVSNGKGMRYFQGSSDPEYRHLPILHYAFYHTIKICLEEKQDYFDLWGYNLYAEEKDPVWGINIFKRGFTKNIILYPKRMHINLKPFGRIIYHIIFFLYKLCIK
jgi:hypothetical protein